MKRVFIIFSVLVIICIFSNISHSAQYWAKTYTTTQTIPSCQAHDIKQTSDGGYIIAGSYAQGTDMDAWIVKLDIRGNIDWQKTIGVTTGWDAAFAIKQTTDGGYIVVGGTRPDDNDAETLLIKMSSNGEIVWKKTFGGEFQSGEDILQTDDGGYLIAINNKIKYNTTLLKLDGNGNLLWGKTYGGGVFDVVITR